MGVAVAVWLAWGAQARAGSGFAFLWADRPTWTAPYTPAAGYQYNSRGGTNQVERSGVGFYHVTIPGVGGLGTTNVQVVAYGGTAARCSLWVFPMWESYSQETRVSVWCTDPSGAPVDSAFDLFLQAYDHEDFPVGEAGAVTVDAYLPDWGNESFNSQGGGVTWEVLPNGTAEVVFEGLSTPGGVAHVTGYYGQECRPVDWSTDGFDTIVHVVCEDPVTGLVPPVFDLSFVNEMSIGRSTGSSGSRRGAHAWTDGYTPGGSAPLGSALAYNDYAWSSAVPSPVGTLERTTGGEYRVRFRGVTDDRTTVLVSMYGSGSGHCKTSGWGVSGADTVIDIRCFDAAGRPDRDTPFVVTLQGRRP